ncbi:hypothetical protein ACU9D5_002196 [Cronobacter dublinensis]|uniref:protein YnhH n=1 Tax=Cronobacter dublinensis TaxID=413497 RepID=UPI003C7D43AE
MNGFSTLDNAFTVEHSHSRRLAEPQAHFLLHAFLMSPILRLWHHNFRNTSLPDRQSTPQGMISISFN